MDGPGSTPLFADHRIVWLLRQLGDIRGWRVLELGPLEAGHTHMLEHAGADVLAIESNHDAFLRCLIVKNLFNLSARIWLGDFTKSFGDDVRYDLAVASGVLYHMTKPVELLRRLSDVSDRLFIWTHYFDADSTRWNPTLQQSMDKKWRSDLIKTEVFEDMTVRLVPHIYGKSLDWPGFCGGAERYSYWLFRDDLTAILSRLGYTRVQTGFDVPDHPNGPSLGILATR